jgi:hypothetical protein
MAKIYTDPTTGDEITKSDFISLKIQDSVIRRWWFLLQFTIVTIACVLTLNVTVVGWWNVYASWLAVAVEQIVGRYMSNQVKRDAQILREVRNLLHETKALVTDIKALSHKDAQHSEADYEIDLDSNQKLTQVLDILSDEYDLDAYYGEWNE